jgi:hypothetical protein
MEASGERHAPIALYPGERIPDTLQTGSWMGLRASTAREPRGKFCVSAGDRIPVIQSVVKHYTDWATPAPRKAKLI